MTLGTRDLERKFRDALDRVVGPAVGTDDASYAAQVVSDAARACVDVACEWTYPEALEVWNFDLRRFLKVQREFNELLQFRRHGRTLGSLSESQRTDAMKDLVLSTAAELFEMLGHLNWKMHKRGRPQDKAKLLEEYVDTFKFVLNFIVYAPFDLEEFVAEFERKSQVVRRRLDEEFADTSALVAGLEKPDGTSGR